MYIYIFLFSEEGLSTIKSEWLIHFFALYWCNCVRIPFILLLFHTSDGITGPFFSCCNLATTLKLRTKYTYCIILLINLPKVSCKKSGEWHFRDPKFKNFLGEHAFQNPLGCIGLSLALQFSSPRTYTFKISCFAPAGAIWSLFFVWAQRGQ